MKLISCVPPEVTVEPQGVSICSGQTATLSVTASGTSPSYQWYQGSSGTTTTPVGGNSSSYTTPVLTFSQNYWVRASNGCGTDDSITVTITVRECAYEPDPDGADFNPDGGSGSFEVTAAAGCAWSASSDSSWLHLAGATSGNGSGSVSYQVEPNNGAAGRQGRITVAGETFTVDQDGQALAQWLHFPRILQDEEWETRLALVNPHGQASDWSLTTHAADGVILARTATVTLPAHGRYYGSLAQFFPILTLEELRTIA